MANLNRLVRGGIPLSAAVRAVLEERGETQREACRRLELNETVVSALLNGTARHPYDATVDALAEDLGVSPLWLRTEIDGARRRRAE